MNFLTLGTWQQNAVCANLNGMHLAQYNLVVGYCKHRNECKIRVLTVVSNVSSCCISQHIS